MHPSQRSPDPDPDPNWVGCVADGCRDRATHDEPLAVTADGDLITEWLCERHGTIPRRLR